VPMADADWPRHHTSDERAMLAFATYDEALWWCRRRDETIHVLCEIESLAVQSECYPERNAWYRDEIERLLTDAGYTWSASDPAGPFFLTACTDSIDAWIVTEMPTAGASACHIQIEASNFDAMWEDLYGAVAKRVRKEPSP
jgi:type II secretory pathway pseudopilin PulG